MADWEEQVRDDVRKAVPPGIAADALTATVTNYGDTKNIKILTPAYPLWLKKTDPSRGVPIVESVKDFRRRRTAYTEAMTAMLDGIRFFDTGSALITEISATTHTLAIRPYTIFADKELGAHAAPFGAKGVGDSEAMQDGTAVGMPRYSPQGGTKPGSGRGKGTNTILDFSPEMWSTEEARAKFSGPGSQGDEILFHEMVHASRLMRGVAYFMPVNQGYDHEEEYLSVLMTNVYLSEKGQTTFRARHQLPNVPLRQEEKFLDNVQGVDMPPIYLIERFRLRTPSFYRDYANIPSASAKFNPIREFDQRRRAGKIKFK